MNKENPLVPVYKDSFKKGNLRSLVFTDTRIAILISIGIAYVTYVIFRHVSHQFNMNLYILLVGGLEILFILIAKGKKDNQEVYKIVPRQVMYYLGLKRFRAEKVGAYFTNFSIQDGLVMRKRSISIVFQINQHDVSALGFEDKIGFYQRVRNALQSLPDQLQLIVKKDPMTEADVMDHFAAINQTVNSVNEARERVIRQYKEELLQTINDGGFLMTKIYGVFSIPTETKKIFQKVQGIGVLHDKMTRLDFALKNCGMSVRQLTNEELSDFMKGQLQ